MPSYDFKCNKCETLAVYVFSISEYIEKGDKLLSNCCSESLTRVIRTGNIIDNCNGFYGRSKA